jgi:hypothetical protein
MTLAIITLSITAIRLSIKNKKLSINDIYHNNTQHKSIQNNNKKQETEHKRLAILTLSVTSFRITIKNSA